MLRKIAQHSTLVLVLIVCTGFGIRLGMNMHYQGLRAGPDPAMGPDHVEYNMLAWNLTTGKGYRLYPNSDFTAWRPPGIPFILAGIYKIFGLPEQEKDPRSSWQPPEDMTFPLDLLTQGSSSYLVVRVLWSLLGALTAIPLFLCARFFLPRLWSLAAAGLLMIYPGHIYYSLHLFSEVPWCFIMTWACWMGIQGWKTQSWRWMLFQGVLLGAATWVRPTAALYPVIQGGLFLLVMYHRHRTLRGPLSAGHMWAVPFAVSMAMALVWSFRNLVVMGHFILFATHGGIAQYGAYNETVLNDPEKIGRWVAEDQVETYAALMAAGDEVARHKKGAELSRAFIQAHRADMPRLLVWRIIRLVQPHPHTPNRLFNISAGVSYGILIPFILWGLLVLAGPGRLAMAIPLHAASLTILISSLLYYGDHRFRISIAPVLLLYACVGGYALYRRCRGKRTKAATQVLKDP